MIEPMSLWAMDADSQTPITPSHSSAEAAGSLLMDDLATWFRRATGWDLSYGGPDETEGTETIPIGLPPGWDERLILRRPGTGPTVPTRVARGLGRTIAVLLQRFVQAETQLRRLEAQAALQADMAKAAQLQAGLTPRLAGSQPALDLETWTQPCHAVGGDFHDLIPLPDDNLGLAIGDACGKGITAALIMAMVRGGLHAHVESLFRVSDIMARLNAALVASTPGDHFMSLFYGVLDLRNRLFSFTNAGHHPPLLWRGGAFRELEAGGLVLGVDPDAPYTETAQGLEPGDLVVLYTDGVTEALDASGNPFGMDRLRAAVATASTRPAAEVVETIRAHLGEFTGWQPQSDDLTLVAFRLTA
jgi:sigma-B regulation protein RsbU (phosphoserine phosphatase)